MRVESLSVVNKPRVRKVAWVVLGVVGVVLVVVGVFSWRYLLYEELEKLTALQPYDTCVMADFTRRSGKLVQYLALYSDVRGRGIPLYRSDNPEATPRCWTRV